MCGVRVEVENPSQRCFPHPIGQGVGEGSCIGADEVVHPVPAAGNVVDPRAQVITAAGAGSAAAIAINADLVLEDVEAAAEDLAASGRATRN